MIAFASDLDFFAAGGLAIVATVFLPFGNGAVTGFMGASAGFLVSHNSPRVGFESKWLQVAIALCTLSAGSSLKRG
jgi:hypothetical protein